MKLTIGLKELYFLFFRAGHGTCFWKKRFGRFGYGSSIAYPSFITNKDCIYIGSNTTILKWSRLQTFNPQNHRSSLSGGGRINIGDRCYIGFHFTILNASSVVIGNDVLIASNVLISSENHGINPESDIPYMNQPLGTKPVEIKDGCWIGENVCILPGITIGNKCIIGAGSVVTKSIPEYSIAAGNPARVIKQYDFHEHVWKKV